MGTATLQLQKGSQLQKDPDWTVNLYHFQMTGFLLSPATWEQHSEKFSRLQGIYDGQIQGQIGDDNKRAGSIKCGKDMKPHGI